MTTITDRLAESVREAFTHLSMIGAPLDSHGNYHKNGDWYFSDALRNPADEEAVSKAFYALKSGLAAYESQKADPSPTAAHWKKAIDDWADDPTDSDAIEQRAIELAKQP